MPFLPDLSQLVRQDGRTDERAGGAADITVRNRCDPPKRAQQRASARKNGAKSPILAAGATFKLPGFTDVNFSKIAVCDPATSARHDEMALEALRKKRHFSTLLSALLSIFPVFFVAITSEITHIGAKMALVLSQGSEGTLRITGR